MRKIAVLIGLFCGCHLLQAQINPDSIKRHLERLCQSDFAGRETAKPGQILAAEYLKNEMQRMGLQPLVKDSSGVLQWFQPWPFARRFGDTAAYLPYSMNVIGMLPATRPSQEYLVVSAHYDHLGYRKVARTNPSDPLMMAVHPGADDNGSGTAGLLEMIRIWTQSKIERPRNLVFIFFSGEEKGLLGSKYFAEYPVIPMNQIIANLNVDMVGRGDSAHALDSHFVYVIGSDKINQHLDIALNKVNDTCCKMSLDYSYNDEKHPDRLYYRSDHYNFAKNNVPVAFFFSGLHPDYHRPTDTPEKINYKRLSNRIELIYHLSRYLIAEGLPTP